MLRGLSFSLFLALLILGTLPRDVQGQEISGFVPRGLDQEQFDAIRNNSPFTRTLNLSDSLILTGVATVDETKLATLLNKETKETYVVSSFLNTQGWKMVELTGEDSGDLEKVAAKITVGGGETVTVRYAESQLKPGETRPGGGGNSNISGNAGKKPMIKSDGKGSDMRAKIMSLSDEQRTKLFEKVKELREKNPDMSRDEVGQYMHKTMEKIVKKR